MVSGAGGGLWSDRPMRTTPCHCPVLATEPEGRLAAILDFTFNLGAGRLQTSTLRRRVNQRDWVSAAQELRRWVYGGGKVCPGLSLDVLSNQTYYCKQQLKVSVLPNLCPLHRKRRV